MSDEMARSARTGALSWCSRMLKGWMCSWRLNRRDVSPMVHSLFDHGEKSAAIAACEQAQVSDPQNVYAYVHAIQLTVRYYRNFAQARLYLERGTATLRDPADRELLTSFHLYATSLNWWH